MSSLLITFLILGALLCLLVESDCEAHETLEPIRVKKSDHE